MDCPSTNRKKPKKCSVSCFVPQCPSTSVKFPDKLFFTVPIKPKLREKWMKAAWRYNLPSPKSVIRCCEDHFDKENDMENWVKYKLVGGKLFLKKGVIPHSFECQQRTHTTDPKFVVIKCTKEEFLQRFPNQTVIDFQSGPSQVANDEPISENMDNSRDGCRYAATYAHKTSKEVPVPVMTPTKVTTVSPVKEKNTNKMSSVNINPNNIIHTDSDTQSEKRSMDEYDETSTPGSVLSDSLSDTETEETTLGVQVNFGSDKVMNKKTMKECRACLQKIDEELCQELFRTWDVSGELIADDLAKIANIKISESDKHSKVICSECKKHLADAYLFVIMVQKNDNMLQKQFDNRPYVDSVMEPVTTSWPKPILLNKNLNGVIDNKVEIEIKQEVWSEDENDSNNMDLDWEPTMDIKIEPEEIVAPVQSDTQHNDAYNETSKDQVHHNGFNICYEEEYLDNIIKQEPLSGDEQEMVPDLPLDCMLCTKTFNSVTGLKAHVISQHSYGTVKRKTDDSLLPEVKKEINEFVCATCRESFETRTDLIVHETCHGKHACYVCNAKFNTFRQLSRHGARCRPRNATKTNRTRSPSSQQKNEPLQKQPRNGPSTDEINIELVKRQANNRPSNEEANAKPVESQSNKDPLNKEIKPVDRQSDNRSVNKVTKVESVQEQLKNEPPTEDTITDCSIEPCISPQIKEETENQSTSVQEMASCNSLKVLGIIQEKSETDMTETKENSLTQLSSHSVASSPYSPDNLEKNCNQQKLELNNLTAANTQSELSLEQKSELQNSSYNIPDEKNSDSTQETVTNTNELNKMKIHLAFNPLNEKDSVLLETKMNIEDTQTATSDL